MRGRRKQALVIDDESVISRYYACDPGKLKLGAEAHDLQTKCPRPDPDTEDARTKSGEVDGCRPFPDDILLELWAISSVSGCHELHQGKPTLRKSVAVTSSIKCRATSAN